MQKKKRKQYTADFKAKVLQEKLREEKTIAQLAAQYQVQSNLLYRWLVDWDNKELPVSPRQNC